MIQINDVDFRRFLRLANAIKVFKNAKASNDISIYASGFGKGCGKKQVYVSLRLNGYLPEAEVKRIFENEYAENGNVKKKEKI